MLLEIWKALIAGLKHLHKYKFAKLFHIVISLSFFLDIKLEKLLFHPPGHDQVAPLVSIHFILPLGRPGAVRILTGKSTGSPVGCFISNT